MKITQFRYNQMDYFFDEYLIQIQQTHQLQLPTIVNVNVYFVFHCILLFKNHYLYLLVFRVSYK